MGDPGELLRLAQLGWCSRKELDAAFVAVGGEVRRDADGYHERYWHPVLPGPSSGTKSVAARSDAGSSLRAYARRVARALASGAPPEEKNAEVPIEATETAVGDRYRPPTAAPRGVRGAFSVAIPTADDGLAASLAADRAARSEARSRSRAAGANPGATDRTAVLFLFEPPYDAPTVYASVVVFPLSNAVVPTRYGTQTTRSDAFAGEREYVAGTTKMVTCRDRAAAVAFMRQYDLVVNQTLSELGIKTIVMCGLADNDDGSSRNSDEDQEAMKSLSAEAFSGGVRAEIRRSRRAHARARPF